MLEMKILTRDIKNNISGRLRSNAVMLAGILAVASPLYTSCGDESESNSCETDKDCKNGYECGEKCTTADTTPKPDYDYDYLSSVGAINGYRETIDRETTTTRCRYICQEKDEQGL